MKEHCAKSTLHKARSFLLMVLVLAKLSWVQACIETLLTLSSICNFLFLPRHAYLPNARDPMDLSHGPSDSLWRLSCSVNEYRLTSLTPLHVPPAGNAKWPGAPANQAKYRDRAAERREVHHQPDKPLPGEIANQAPKRKFAEGPKPPPSPPPPAIEPGQDETNRGNQLLAKMGWKTGVGLGVTGDGRVDPVMVQQFENRAGLGASKGHDAGKWQGPGGFQARAKDMVSGFSLPSDRIFSETCLHIDQGAVRAIQIASVTHFHGKKMCRAMHGQHDMCLRAQISSTFV